MVYFNLSGRNALYCTNQKKLATPEIIKMLRIVKTEKSPYQHLLFSKSILVALIGDYAQQLLPKELNLLHVIIFL